MHRLGLDIGSNSIGWCLIEDDTHIVALGSRIFSDGRDPKSGASLAVDRRLARGMRRRRDRYVRRRSAFLETLVDLGLMPVDADEARLVAMRDPYALRARALDESLLPHEIGRVLFHLNQRRGFKSNRKAERGQKDSESGLIETGARALDAAMAEAGARTLGEFLAGRLGEGKAARVRLNGEAQAYDFYPQRAHIEAEFGAIWAAQAPHHPALLTDAARDRLARILFFQRPLKEPKVGLCLFAGKNGVPLDEARLAKAHPLFQERRLYEEVNQLAITEPGEPAQPLTRDQRDRLVLLLQDKREQTFEQLARALKLQPGQSFNKASAARTKLTGNEVRAVMKDKKRFGDDWLHLSTERQWDIVQRVQDEEDPAALQAFLTGECGLSEERAQAVAKAPLPQGHGRIGKTATSAILEHLKAEVIPYSRAVELAGWHHSDERTGEELPKLPYYGELLSREIPPGTFADKDAANPEVYWGKITNPTVHIGLRQLEKVINAVIAVHGRPDEIVVELARELNLSEEEKKKHQQRIKRDTEEAQRRGRMLETAGIPDSGSNRAKLKLWEELAEKPQDRFCPYCGIGGPIAIHALFSDAVDIDHIIPYSRSLDDSAGNKVVVHRACNRDKGNKTPFERWGHDAQRWDKIAAQVAKLPRAKQWRFGPDAMTRFEQDGGFIARQLTDTQYLSRMAGKYLRSLYPDKGEGSQAVYVATGRMTALLRRVWGLNSLLPDHNYVSNPHSNAPKNRLDHRHHAIDAAVMAVTTPRLLKQIADAAARAEAQDLDRLFADLRQPWSGFREELGEKVNAVTVSHKADHGRKHPPAPGKDSTAARLHNDTAYGLTGEVAPDGKTPIVVHRVPLLSLKPADIASATRIPDPALRQALADATRGKAGKDFEATLRRLAQTHPVFRGLRRVRVREPLSVIAIRDKAGRAYKAYKGDANARFDVWRLPDGKWVSDIVSMFAAHQPGSSDRRPHPAARKVLSLRQNDMLAIERDGIPAQIVRVVKFSINGMIVLAEDEEAGPLKARDADAVDPFKYINSSATGLKRLKARQIRIDPLGRVFDPGPRE
ncbi:type II CRISPR RNA-guided endonuclease Cas9 [Novosphingobium pituita]|uniref:CRISPR-associated endonuclease Cas9 n=1 Tax=Novosphingobium pituita TaxID=3056842 RepID=A0ABQ6PAU8_9SPHN|nr:type II CRISPR RNA-guided endonuclease Cas9 [Novosphingobium sp. IK01]GMM62364.1 hypothetical protein NUTIK01_31410 [Novosphingobium sp. IK01]